MRIATYNVRGLAGKADLVQKLWDETRLDILGLTETWLRPTDRFPLPLQYEGICLERDGRRHRTHGGIALAFRNSSKDKNSLQGV